MSLSMRSIEVGFGSVMVYPLLSKAVSPFSMKSMFMLRPMFVGFFLGLYASKPCIWGREGLLIPFS